MLQSKVAFLVIPVCGHMFIFLEISLVVLVAALALSAFTIAFFARKSSLSSKLLDEVMDASEYGNIIFDDDGAFFKVNKLALSYLEPIIDGNIEKLTRSEFLNCLFDNAADIDESIRNTILKDFGGENGSEFREVIYCDGVGCILVDAKVINGGMTSFLLNDINVGQKREEDIISLNSFNQQLMHAVQATTSGIVISDPNSDTNAILFANDAFCEFVNCDLNELLGCDWSVLVDMVQDEKAKAKLVNALDNIEETDVMLESSSDDGVRYFNMKLTPAMDDDGGFELFIGVLSEVTLLKQRESEFFHSQKLESLGKLSAGVAHDFNNILSIIGGYSVMAANLLEGENQQVSDYLNRIDAASKRGAALTSKMLTFSRHKVVTNTVINVCEVIEEQSELLMPLLGVSINLRVDIPKYPVNIKGSADSLGQILMNFVVNGRDAMEEGGDLCISVKVLDPIDVPRNVRNNVKSDEYVCISVSDKGTGMDDATLEKVFDPFFSTKDQGKGTGLGLSVVYGLVQEMGGAIDVSTVLGEGTKMSFYLPLCHDKQSKQILGDETDLSTICLDGYSVLVAEDEPDLLILVTNMLEELGLKVYGASDGDEALVLLDDNLETGIDILLTDVVMPNMNGVKLAELVAAMSPDTKIIFMSGYPANGDMAPVELPKDLSFVAKPVNYQALAALLLNKLREGTPETLAFAAQSMPSWETNNAKKEGARGRSH